VRRRNRDSKMPGLHSLEEFKTPSNQRLLSAKRKSSFHTVSANAPDCMDTPRRADHDPPPRNLLVQRLSTW